ncbi:DUF3871 family protein [Dysgonomonas sp. BGC7]|uniref:DUF3871 family protein n=1 Tax=Dysgonomonas sp. BGC7 TaxID=1658008 RepID=UPI0006834805|nr:DUF3871 family protein [Dysgonomonas sp. BGC7]MBD8388849.1 DUF3871 family protein [Dysgonomonas sp. BGC7]
METMQLITVKSNHTDVMIPQPLPLQNAIENTYICDNNPSPFIEANTKEASLHHLKHECIVPVFSKDNEVTISHTNFIETVWDAASSFFPNETILQPDIRVSHVVKGRVPEAINKPVSQLLESDKTVYYERMAFCFEVPTIFQDIEGNRLNLSIGGVRALNHENLYSKKSIEKFKIFIGFKNLVCTNLCVSTDGYKSELRVMSLEELFKATLLLFQQYNPNRHLELMSSFQNSYLTEHQFAQLIGKSKFYQCLPNAQKKLLPNMEFGDTHINAVAKAYYNDKNFRIEEGTDAINLWKVYNLFTGANKNSYIDNILDRSLNATELLEGINRALHGDREYRWFIE